MKRSTTFAALALACALAMTGCGTDSSEQDPGAAGETAAPVISAPTATSTGEPIAAEHNDDDVKFAQMMIPHHEQAVDMSETLLAKDDIPAEAADFAQQVIAAQGPEIQRMNQMLEAWGEEPMMDSGGMEGMDHGSGSGSGSGMSGMMSEEDMQALEDVQGIEAARLYLEQMTVHHEGAVEMARDQVEQGQNPQAVELARRVVEDQEAEITEMEQMLHELSDQS